RTWRPPRARAHRSALSAQARLRVSSRDGAAPQTRVAAVEGLDHLLHAGEPAIRALGEAARHDRVEAAELLPWQEPLHGARGLVQVQLQDPGEGGRVEGDRKSTRLNSSHVKISYAVFCLKK